MFSTGNALQETSTYMKYKKYKVNDMEFLIYSEEDFNFPEELKLTGEESSLDEELPIYNYKDFMLAILGKKTRDKILESEGIVSFKDLKYAYNLVRNKMLNKSKRIRDLVVDKYVELND